MRKRICALLAGLLLLSVFVLPASGAEASEGETSTPALVSIEYLQNQLEALRKELLAAIAGASNGGASEEVPQGAYRDVTLPRGSVITLGDDAEVIFRGGNAVLLTVSSGEGEGATDLAAGEELFSGDALQFAHIYYKTTSHGRVSLLVTGERAAFTLKGTYAIT